MELLVDMLLKQQESCVSAVAREMHGYKTIIIIIIIIIDVITIPLISRPRE
jgi:hypothetical protein